MYYFCAMEKKIIKTNAAPAPIGPYNQAIQFGNLLFISGQVPLDVATGKLVTGTIQEETHKVMENLSAILEEAGMNFDNVLKSSIFILDMKQFAEINQVYGDCFKGIAPARETIQVAALPLGARVEISVIAGK